VKSFIAESGVEEVCLDYLADLGWDGLYGPEITPDGVFFNSEAVAVPIT